MYTIEYVRGLIIAAIKAKNSRPYPYTFIYADLWYEARSEDCVVPIKLEEVGEVKPKLPAQLDVSKTFPWVLGQFTGLQIHPEVKAIIIKRLGSEEDYEKLAESLFKIAQEFYPPELRS